MVQAVDLKQVTDTANAVTKRALRGVNVQVIDVKKLAGPGSDGSTAAQSNVLSQDPFSALVGVGKLIEPPFDPLRLAMLPEQSSELGQCVEAMQDNIEGFGFRFVSRLKIAGDPTEGEEGSAELKAAKEEYARLTNFFQYCTVESFVNFRKKIRRDYETTGNAFYEVMRSPQGEVQGFTHIPSYQMRLGVLDDDPILVERKLIELRADGSVGIKKVMQWRKFRKFAQARSLVLASRSVTGNYRMRWFKEHGDPRRMDKNTGEFESPGHPVADGDLATEVVHAAHYSGRSPYGIPRYIGNLLSIHGDRKAEEINYVTFQNNNIPSLALLVSNGQLTEGTITRLKQFMEEHIQGDDNYSKIVIIEAESLGEEGEDGSQVKVDLKPLTKDQHTDALFQNYSANCQDKIRRAFRLPALFVGKSEGYNRATAEADRRLADEQIFGPERDEFDSFVNRILFPEMGIIYHRFKTNSPSTTDNAQLVKILAGGEKTGALTPRIGREMMGDILGREMPDFTDDYDPDVPFSLTMAEAVKNMADPTEPGQQVTAIKVLKALGFLGNDPPDGDEPDDAIVESIAKRIADLVQHHLAAE